MVGGILIGSGTGAGAVVGLILALVVALVAAPIDALSTLPRTTGAGLIGAGAALDAVRLVVGRPTPPTAGRQVPREWARWFSPPVTALLYGARLGVGPLTILSTWTWWSFTLAASLSGPGPGALAGAAFGLTKLATIALVSTTAGPGDHPRVFGRLRTGRRPGWAALTALTLALAASASASACGGPGGTGPIEARRSAEPVATTMGPALDEPVDTTTGTAEQTTSEQTTSEQTTPVRPITPARLEDVVRTSIPEPARIDPGDRSQAPAATVAPATAAATPSSLADDLLSAIVGYRPIDGPEADRHLDLRAAADIQPDPTEEIALLETRGYRGGWVRAFRNHENDVAVATVYQFDDEAEAEFYLEDGLITIGGYGGSFFDIPDLPGVRGFVQHLSSSDSEGPESEAGEDLVSIGASFHRRDRWYLLYFVGSPERVTPEVLVPAIAEQYRSAGG